MALRLPFGASLFQQKLLAAACWLLALALTAWIAAGWFWRMQGRPQQAAVASPTADPKVAAQDIASRQLFGMPQVAPANNTAAPPPSLVVTGVQTQWGKLPGFAIVRDGSGPNQSWVEGENIAPGIKLLKVRADGIDVERNGVREFIALRIEARPAGELVIARPAPATTAPAAPQEAEKEKD